MVRPLPSLTGLPVSGVVRRGVCIAVTLLSGGPNAALQSADEPAFDEEIIVTGSRIRRNPLSARESVLGLEANDSDRTGLTSLGDMLAQLWCPVRP